MQCCVLNSYDGDTPDFYATKTVSARKAHSCGECRDPIPVGTRHEYVSGKWSGDFSTYRTCLSCVEIRDHFVCAPGDDGYEYGGGGGSGFVFGEVWSSLRETFFPTMRAGGPCLEGLSPEAKGRLFDRRNQWLEEQS